MRASELVSKLNNPNEAKILYNRFSCYLGDHKLKQDIADVESCQ